MDNTINTKNDSKCGLLNVLQKVLDNREIGKGDFTINRWKKFVFRNFM